MKENLVDEGVKPSLNIYVRPQSKKSNVIIRTNYWMRRRTNEN